MSNAPIEFDVTDITINATLSLSYTFDKIVSVNVTESVMPFRQTYIAKCLMIELEGKTANPNISVSIDAVTRLFTLNCCYITDIYPRMKNTVKDKCFVIDGYSNQNIDKERVLIYLPMSHTTTTDNLFYPLETAMVESITTKKNISITNGLDLNDYIPNTHPENHLFTYYKYTDHNAYTFHIIYFNISPLKYTSGITLPSNTDLYTSTRRVINYKTTHVSRRHDNMTNQFEDNIYIDCVPVDLENKNEETYLKIDKKYVSYFSEAMTYFSYIIMLTLVVYGIYSIYNYASSPATPPKS